MVSGTGLNAVATYTCDAGYNIEGQSTRMCEEPGPEWSGSSPSCNSKLLNLINASVY